MSKATNEAVIEKYAGADAIIRLHRSKKLNGLQRAIDFGVAAFTPFTGVYDEADMIANGATHYLVKKDGEEILVHANREGIVDEVVTGKLQRKKKEFQYKGYRYAANEDLISGEKFFHMLL